MLDIPILDENGVPVASSWAEAKDTGATSFFAGPDEGCPHCGSRRYITATLACWACANPPAPGFSDVAPDYATALARGFRRYHAEAPCEVKGHDDVYTTATQRCGMCESEEATREREERAAARAAQERQERAEWIALVKEERRVAREARAEERQAEAALQAITRTVGRTRKTLKRAQEMLTALPDDNTPPAPRGPAMQAPPAPSLPRAETPAVGSAEERELVREAVRDAVRGRLVHPYSLRQVN